MNRSSSPNPTPEPKTLTLARTTLPRTRLVRTLLLALSAASLTLAGCHKKASGVNPASLGPTADLSGPPPTASLTADPVAINLGQTVVLNWRTSNANAVTIDGIGQVNVNGTQTVSPATSTNFHLVAKGEGGTVEANVRVTVRAAAPTPTTGTTTFAADQADRSLVTDQQFKAAVQDVFFDYDSSDLRPDAQQAATQAAAFLVAHPNLRILIGGYADERGSAEYNLALGESRANAAKTGLTGAGVAPSRIRVISYGKEKQFCTEANETCWQENRRAQFTIDK